MNNIEALPLTPELVAEFDAAARRPLQQRLKYAFIKTYKPVKDDEDFRSFDSMDNTALGAKRTFQVG